MKESPQSLPATETSVPSEDKGNSYNQLKDSYKVSTDKIKPGFATAGPRFASPEEPIAKSTIETLSASLSQGTTASIFNGFQFDKNATIDPDYDVKADMRPGDERYAAVLATSPNSEQTQKFLAAMDRRNEALETMSVRPWTSFFGQMLDPIQLGIDIGTYGLGATVSLPLLANAARRTETGLSFAKTLKQAPKVENALKEAFIGSQAGALSMAAQTKIKSGSSLLETDEDIGEHAFFGFIIGGALGGTVGYLGKKRTDEIVEKFREGNNVTQGNTTNPPEFVGPIKPNEEIIPSMDLRAQAPKEEPIKRNPDEIKSDIEKLKAESSTGGDPERIRLYGEIKSNMMKVGENLIEGTNLPKFVKKAVSLVGAPFRNMSATNRLISSPLGTARLYAISMARNAAEFVGTRGGFILPRSVQNRIEDISNQALDMQIDLFQYYLKANNIEPGAFAAEKSLLGEQLYEQTKFFEDVATEMLHIGRPSAKGRSPNPIVTQAAKHVYDNLYEPIGELLKQYGFIEKNADAQDILNYLNRHWSQKKILDNPEAFIDWASDIFLAKNEQLRFIEPNYKKEIEFSKILEKDSKEFAKAAKKIDKLKEKIKKSSAKGKENVADIEELKRLLKKYSRAGLVAKAERVHQEQLAKSLSDRGLEGSDEIIKRAKQEERRAIENAPIVDESHIIAKELKEDAQMVKERAEAMIPYELRSNKTGEPYKTWDPVKEPEYARSIAERTMYTMLGQEDEIVTNPVLTKLSGGKTNFFKARDFKIPDDQPGIEQWVERDMRVLLNNFANGVAPPIGLHESMMELNKLPIVRKTVKRMQVLDPSIGPKKALDLPSEMTDFNEIPKVFASMMREEYRLAAKGIHGEELEKLHKQYTNAEKDLATLDAQVRGVFGQGVNVNSSTIFELVDLINSAASTVTNNNIVISMFSDLAAPTIRYGFEKHIQTAILPLLSSPELRALGRKEAQSMHLALNAGLGSIIKNRISGKEGSLKNSTIGKGILNVANRLGSITGSNGLQDVMDIAAVTLIKSELINMAERVAKGTVTKKELTHMAQRNLSPEKAKDIYEMWQKYGYKHETINGIDPAKLENPSFKDAKAYLNYENFIRDELKTVNVKPGIGSLPDISYSPAGRAILFLKKFFFASSNDLLYPALQRADKEAVQGFMGMLAIGALQTKLRQLYRGEEAKEFKLEGFIVEALSNSGLLGAYTFGLDAALVEGVISGTGGARYDPSNGLASLLVGPGVVGYSDKLLKILGKIRKITTDEDKQFTYKDFNYMANTTIPLYKWAPISAVAKPKIKEYFESQGRGE